MNINILRTLAHGFVTAAVVGAGSAVQSGGPITSGNVLLPALLAGVLGMVSAIMPSTAVTPLVSTPVESAATEPMQASLPTKETLGKSQ
jgi:hypothetical protein